MAGKTGAPPPPAARQAVVIRAGPPQDKGRRRDLVVGALGLLLLVLSGAMVKVLPEKDVLRPQFRVTVIDVVHENGTTQGPYLQGAGDANEADVTYVLPLDGIFKIDLGVGLIDDVPASYSDVIEFGFFDPSDELLVDTFSLATKQPDFIEGPAAFTGEFVANHTAEIRSYEICPRPGDSIVTGLPHETEAELVRRLMEENFCPSQGAYRVHARLTAAGDCPSTQASDNLERAFACQQDTQGNGTDADPGNAFDVEGLTYYTYVLVVEKLEF